MSAPEITPVEDGGRRRYDADGEPIVDLATCGHCGRTWDDALITSLTPAPSGRCPFEYEHVYPEPSIRRTYFGGREDQTFEEFATRTIQDEEEAAEIAEQMLAGEDLPHAYNAEEPEFYEEFEVIDRDALRRQLDELRGDA